VKVRLRIEEGWERVRGRVARRLFVPRAEKIGFGFACSVVLHRAILRSSVSLSTKIDAGKLESASRVRTG